MWGTPWASRRMVTGADRAGLEEPEGRCTSPSSCGSAARVTKRSQRTPAAAPMRRSTNRPAAQNRRTRGQRRLRRRRVAACGAGTVDDDESDIRQTQDTLACKTNTGALTEREPQRRGKRGLLNLESVIVGDRPPIYGGTDTWAFVHWQRVCAAQIDERDLDLARGIGIDPEALRKTKLVSDRLATSGIQCAYENKGRGKSEDH